MPYSAGTVRDIPVRALKLCGLTWSGEFLWFSEGIRNQIMAVDPHTGQVEHQIACPDVRSDMTTLSGRLVQIVGAGRVLRVIDPQTGGVISELPNPRPGHVLSGIEASSEGVWLGYEDLRVIDLRSAADFRLLSSIPVSRPVAGVTVSDNYLVYADYPAAVISFVDIERGTEAASFSVHGNPTGITWDGSRIWYCDHTTLQLRAIEIPGIVRR